MTAATLNGYGLIIEGANVQATMIADLGSTALEDGSAMSAALSLSGSVSMDAASSLRVGAADGSAEAGAPTVEYGATASTSGTIDGNVVANGTISSYDLDLFGSIGGSGQLTVGASGLYLDGGASVTVGIGISGTNEPLFLLDAKDMHATISGFAPGDTLDLGGIFGSTSVA